MKIITFVLPLAIPWIALAETDPSVLEVSAICRVDDRKYAIEPKLPLKEGQRGTLQIVTSPPDPQMRPVYVMAEWMKRDQKIKYDLDIVVGKDLNRVVTTISSSGTTDSADPISFRFSSEGKSYDVQIAFRRTDKVVEQGAAAKP